VNKHFPQRKLARSSSVGMSTLMALLHIGMQAQCLLMNAGLIQGKETYKNHPSFNVGSLKAKIPFPTDSMVILYIYLAARL
jgi:hypothetical protein